jgi:hypothetical protein
MQKDEISNEDKIAFREIYEQVKKTPPDLSFLPQIESLLNKALQIAEKYGTTHPLYFSLDQTMQEQLIPAKKIQGKPKDKSYALADLKLFILGDLLGWF